MGVKIQGFDEAIANVVLKAKRIETAVKFRLIILGQSSVSHAERNGSYKDQTKWLRNSIAYVLLEDGQVVEEKYKNDAGRKALEDFSVGSESGITLVVVAGADYARHVENKGYNVISKTEQFMERKVKSIVRSIIKELE